MLGDGIYRGEKKERKERKETGRLMVGVKARLADVRRSVADGTFWGQGLRTQDPGLRFLPSLLQLRYSLGAGDKGRGESLNFIQLAADEKHFVLNISHSQGLLIFRRPGRTP